MTNTPEPAAFPPPPRVAVVPWWWRLNAADGSEIAPEGGRQEFPNRSDAESWLGEAYPELADEGVSEVTLFEGDREVYGPMSLEA